jgi:hypothetical protein
MDHAEATIFNRDSLDSLHEQAIILASERDQR